MLILKKTIIQMKIIVVGKYSITLIVLFLLSGCQKKKCNGFYFSDNVIENVPKIGSKFNVNFDNGLQANVAEVIIDSTDYAVATPLNYQECESVIMVIYSIDNYEFTVRVSKKEEETNIFCSISGINLSKYIEFADEEEFLKSKYEVYRLSDMNDTIMSIHMNGLKIKNIGQNK